MPLPHPMVTPAAKSAGLVHWLVAEPTSNLATLIGYIALAIAGGFALWRWNHDRREKRMELMLARMRSFDATPGSRNAVAMLYNHERDIELFDPSAPVTERYARVTWNDSARALMPPYLLPQRLDNKSHAIRDSFEDFLARLGEIELLLELKLLNEEDGQRIVAPWVRRFGLTAIDTDVVRILRLYIEFRKMISVQHLFKRYGIDLTATTVADCDIVQAQIADGRWVP